MKTALALVFVLLLTAVRADQIEMRNGDRYSGKVTGLTGNHVILKSELLGTLRIRRDSVLAIRMGEQPLQLTAPVEPPSGTNAPLPKAPPVPVISVAAGPGQQIDMHAPVSHLIAANPQLVAEIRNQVLAGAGTNAVAEYDALVNGLASGELGIADIGREASSVAAQLRELRGSEDAETAEIFNEYLSILDSFVAVTKPVISSTSRPENPGRSQAKKE